MKLHRTKCLVILTFILCILMHTASAAPVISIEPASIEVSQGDSYTVQIMVDPAGFEIFGSEYKLSFDNSLLHAVDQSKGTFLNQDGTDTTNIRNKINNSIGIVEYGEMRTGVDYGVSTRGILAMVVFNATGSGVCDLVLSEVVLSDIDANEIPDIAIQNGICTITSDDPTSNPSATAVQSNTDLTPPLPDPDMEFDSDPDITQSPEPQITETISSTLPAQTEVHTEDETNNQSGSISVSVTAGLFILLYIILKRK